MTSRRFSILLIFISVLSLTIVNVSRNINDVFRQNYTLSVWSIILFAGICALMYPLSVSALKSSNKYLFTNVTFSFIFIKMLLSVTLILVYQWRFHPSNYWFVAPFFIIYAIFTIFEVYFTTKLLGVRKRLDASKI